MKIFSILLLAFAMIQNSLAQNQTALAGQPSQIKFNIANVVNTNKCNIEVTLPNQQKVGVEVEGPQFIASVEFTPQQTGSTAIAWEGKTKVRGLATVFACPGSGIIQVQVNGNNEQITQQWSQYFAKVPEEIRDCVKVGMDLSQIKYQSLSDPNAALTSPEDPKLKPIYEKCDNFAKQIQPRKAAPCTLPNMNNLKTICDGAYAERQPDGRLKPISRTNAVQLHFEGKPWTVGILENADARTARLKQEEEEKSKQAANIAAQKEAEEKERRYKESPEYKKQQADLERKRIADEKEAALKIKKDQEESERAEKEKVQREKLALEARRIQEEKQKIETERAEKEKAQREKIALETRRAQEEKQRLEYAKEFPYYAVITCGSNYNVNFPAWQCFSGSRKVDTELEIRNGSAYKMYTFVEMMQMDLNDGRLIIDLRQKFELKMQNASDSFILNLKIYDRTNKQISFEKSAARFGVIRISN